MFTSKPENGTSDRLVDEIDEAAVKFGIDFSSCELIRHNENITCKIDADDKTYSLRIHCPVDGFDTGAVYAAHSKHDLFSSEAELLKYMHKNGFTGLQEPIAGRDGQYICQLSDGSSAMLLRWVERDTIAKENINQYIERFAELAVKIHRTSKGFCGLRPCYDENMVNRLIAETEKAVNNGYLTDEWGVVCKSELSAIKDWFFSHNRDLNQYGIIHADLGLDNIIDTRNELIPIDFSLSGYGPYTLEAGMLISNFPERGQKERLVEAIQIPSYFNYW